MISFAQPVFLYGLLGMAAPLVLHLMQRQIPRRLVFPSIRFILKGRDAQQGRRGIRDLLTLLARMAMIGIAVLLFAEPRYAQSADTTSEGKEAASILLFVDLSASMNAGDFQGYAMAQVEQLSADFPEAQWGMIASANGIRSKLSFGKSLGEIRAALRSMSPTIFKGQHDAALQEIEPMLFGRKNRVIAILSDMQAADWGAVDLASISRLGDLRILKPVRKTNDNIAVVGVQFEQFVRKDTRLLQATVRVRNHGLTAQELKLRLRAGKQATDAMVKLSGESTSSVLMTLKGPETQEAVVELLNGDIYPVDDAYHFWIGPMAPVRVAIVLGDRPSSQLEALFLKKALSVKQAGFDTYQVEVFTPTFFLKEKLSRYQCIFVLDSLRNTPDFQLEPVKEWLSAGGSLVYFSGKDSGNCLAKLEKAGLCSSRYMGHRGDPSQVQSFNIQTVAERNSILSTFHQEPSDLLSFPVYRYIELQKAKSANVMLTLGSGDPLLISEVSEKGNCYIFAIGLLPGWSDLPTSQCFLPLVRRIVEFSPSVEDRGILKLTAGEPSQGAKELFGQNTPAFDEVEVKLVQSVPVQVNATRAESDLRPVEDIDLGRRVEDPRATAGAVKSTTKTLPFTRTIAIALLLVFLAELVLANTRQRTSGKQAKAA